MQVVVGTLRFAHPTTATRAYVSTENVNPA